MNRHFLSHLYYVIYNVYSNTFIIIVAPFQHAVCTVVHDKWKKIALIVKKTNFIFFSISVRSFVPASTAREEALPLPGRVRVVFNFLLSY